jgi:antitoxin component of MazEF toxin-antitoxin module
MSKTVKAREHYGANSLDLTIPADVVKEHDVNPGDIFEIVINSEDGELVLTYKRVYQD